MSAAQRKARSWCAERLAVLFGERTTDDSRKIRMLDFFFLPGKVSAKVQDEAGKLHRVEVSFDQLSDKEWETLFLKIAPPAFFVASLLAGALPEEIGEVDLGSNRSLCPSTREEIAVMWNADTVTDFAEYIPAAVLDRLVSRLNEEPFLLFLLRGKGREETLLELKRQRMNLVRPKLTVGGEDNHSVLLAVQQTASSAVYWSTDPEIFKLSYSIRADELPAAILKRLDPLPLNGLEDQIEFQLEEAYAQVARRAQAYGLGLK